MLQHIAESVLDSLVVKLVLLHPDGQTACPVGLGPYEVWVLLRAALPAARASEETLTQVGAAGMARNLSRQSCPRYVS